MPEKRTFKVHLRIGTDGQTYAVTDHEIDEGTNLDSVWMGDGPFYDTVIEVTAPEMPEEPEVAARVEIDRPAAPPVEARAAAD